MVSRRLRERRATLLVPWATSCTSAVRAQAIDRIDGRVRRRRSARDYYMYCCCCCCRRRHWQPGGREKNAHHTKTAAASNATPLSSRSDADEVVTHRSTGTRRRVVLQSVPRRACTLQEAARHASDERAGRARGRRGPASLHLLHQLNTQRKLTNKLPD